MHLDGATAASTRAGSSMGLVWFHGELVSSRPRCDNFTVSWPSRSKAGCWYELELHHQRLPYSQVQMCSQLFRCGTTRARHCRCRGKQDRGNSKCSWLIRRWVQALRNCAMGDCGCFYRFCRGSKHCGRSHRSLNPDSNACFTPL